MHNMPYKTPGGMCNKNMFWQNTWNMKQLITGLKSQLVEGSQLAIQAWPRR